MVIDDLGFSGCRDLILLLSLLVVIHIKMVLEITVDKDVIVFKFYSIKSFVLSVRICVIILGVCVNILLEEVSNVSQPNLFSFHRVIKDALYA